MVEVVATQVQTYRVRRSNGTEAVVVASDDRNTLEIYGRTADRKVWIKRNDMNPEMTQTAVISVIKGLERFGSSDYSDIAEYVKTEFNNKFWNTNTRIQCFIFIFNFTFYWEIFFDFYFGNIPWTFNITK